MLGIAVGPRRRVATCPNIKTVFPDSMRQYALRQLHEVAACMHCQLRRNPPSPPASPSRELKRGVGRCLIVQAALGMAHGVAYGLAHGLAGSVQRGTAPRNGLGRGRCCCCPLGHSVSGSGSVKSGEERWGGHVRPDCRLQATGPVNRPGEPVPLPALRAPLLFISRPAWSNES